MEPISVRDVLEWTGGLLIQGKPDIAIRAVCTDSRKVAQCSLFVALKGERFDGHDFLADAFKGGAVAAMVQRGRWIEATLQSTKAAIIEVEDTLTALGKLAQGYFRQFEPYVIAVTGSAGKTTTKEMIGFLLSLHLSTVIAPESYNNEIGVPMTVLQLEKRHAALVLEFAMRNPSDITYLCHIAPPTVGVITNIGKAHIGRLGSQQAIAEAKAELLEGMATYGTAVLNADDAFFAFLRSKAPGRVVSFGIEREADVRASKVRLDGGSASFDLIAPQFAAKPLSVRIKVPGKHNVANALAALAVCGIMGVGLEECAAALPDFAPPKMRLEIHRSPKGFTVINDAYNANPASVLAALDVLQNLNAGGRKIAVLGEMLELGEFSYEEHLKVGRACGFMGVDVLIVVGEGAKPIADGARSACGLVGVWEVSDVEAAKAVAKELAREGDAILVKASRAVGLDKVAKELLG